MGHVSTHSEVANFYPHQPSRFHNEDVFAVSQKLDHMVTKMMDEKPIIEKGKHLKNMLVLLLCSVFKQGSKRLQNCNNRFLQWAVGYRKCKHLFRR